MGRMGRRDVFRGHVYYCDLGVVVGSEQKGVRPVLVVSNGTCNRVSPTVTIVILTSQEKVKLPTHSYLSKQDYPFLTSDSTIECEQIRTVDKLRITEFLGVVKDKDMELVDKCLKIQMGL